MGAKAIGCKLLSASNKIGTRLIMSEVDESRNRDLRILLKVIHVTIRNLKN